MRRLINVGALSDLGAPGDYCLTSRCPECDAHGHNRAPAEGGAVPYHYTGCSRPAPVTGFVMKCACGGLYSSNRAHVIVTPDPLTVSPSWLCPQGCHVYIGFGTFGGQLG